jgi:hypothetical protein
MENIIEKLSKINDKNKVWNDWTVEEIKQLLEIYFVICKKENHIFNLIYEYHGCDSWEDIFRDYDMNYLQDKANGVEDAINELDRIVKEVNNS